MTTTAGVNDHAANELAARGARAGGAQVHVLASPAVSDYAPNLAACAARQPDLVLAAGPEMANPVWQAAQVFPRVHFGLIDAEPRDAANNPARLPNVAAAVFREADAGYLVGVLAGLMENEKVGAATHNVTGVLGLNHGPAVDEYIAGYVAGARSVDPTIAIKLTYSDSQDPVFCKQLGLGQVGAGADILLAVTGRCAGGYIEAAYASSVYAIGSGTDQAYLSPAVITSAVKRMDRAATALVERLGTSGFHAGTAVYDLENEGTGYSTPASIVPQDIIRQVEDVRLKIRNGAIIPPQTIPPI